MAETRRNALFGRNTTAKRGSPHYAQNVLDNKITDTSFLPGIYAAPHDAPWDSLETFKECNPGYGITIDETTAKTLISEARNEPLKKMPTEYCT
jgi:phage terminase large subunit-like protein